MHNSFSLSLSGQRLFRKLRAGNFLCVFHSGRKKRHVKIDSTTFERSAEFTGRGGERSRALVHYVFMKRAEPATKSVSASKGADNDDSEKYLRICAIRSNGTLHEAGQGSQAFTPPRVSCKKLS